MATLSQTLGKRCVNHKNGIKHDNKLENLEWCTHSENNLHAYKIGTKRGAFTGKRGALHPRSHHLYQYNSKGEICGEWDAVASAERDGFKSVSILNCINGSCSTYKGFIWSYSRLSKRDVILRFKKLYKNKAWVNSCRSSHLAVPENKYWEPQKNMI